MATWRIVSGNVDGTFATYSLGHLRRSRYSQRADLVTFDAPGAAFDSDPIIAAGATVQIFKDAAQWFYGRCIRTPSIGAATTESVSYEIAGPWWHLENCPYEQQWAVYSGGALTVAYKPRIVLGQAAGGAAITTGIQITQILQYAIDKGAPFQIGTIMAGFYVPYEEQTNLSCAEAIIALLRWHPDCVAWFDYSTTPPTIHVTAKADMTATSISVDAGAPNESIAIKPRNDLVLPGVKFVFESTSTVDGVEYNTLTTQTAGDYAAFGALVALIPLGGSTASYLRQAITTGTYPETMTDKTFWKAMVPALSQYADADITISNVTRGGAQSYPRYLLPGTGGDIQDWMDVGSEEETITADLALTVKDGDGDVCTVHSDKPLVLILISTNATTRNYQTLASYEAGESAPASLATNIYAAWSQLQYEGRIALQEDECCGSYYPGRTLNLTGGQAAWESMAAMITGVDEDVDSGRTLITIGPCQWLGADDIITLFNRLRTRQPAYSYPGRATGLAGDTSGTYALDPSRSVGKSAAADGQPTRIAIRVTDSGNKKVIDLNPLDMTTAQALTAKMRLLDVCEDGTAKKMWVLASETYTP